VYIIYALVMLLVGLVIIICGLYRYILIRSIFLEWEILHMNSVSVVYTVILDWVRLVFCGTVLFISSIVLIYSSSYIAADRSPQRFVILVALFVLSMLIIVLSPNMVSILLGWDGLGLVSYGLVVYYQNIKSANAGIVTILSNRLGDIAILVRVR